MTRVVVIGAGFAGIEVARALGRANIPVTLIDRQNHHLFQPLLYQVATAALSPADIAEPIRKMLRGHPSVEVMLGEVSGIDTAARTVTLGGRRASYPYDILVIATGATHSYFGHDEWDGFAPGLKTIEDARNIRSRLLLAFERAEMSRDPAEQKRLMTIAVIGGGPTGVELAGSIAELARHTLAKDFHRIRAETATVLLLEAGPRILTAFPRRSRGLCGAQTRQSSASRCGRRRAVERITEHSVTAAGEDDRRRFRDLGGGRAASPLGQFLGVRAGPRRARDREPRSLGARPRERLCARRSRAGAGRSTASHCQAWRRSPSRKASISAARWCGKSCTAKPPKPFVFHNRGNTAIIGRHAAVFDFGWCAIKGWIAWCLWALIHVYLLVGFQHRLLVAIQWLWRYVTYERGSRLITERKIANRQPKLAPESPFAKSAVRGKNSLSLHRLGLAAMSVVETLRRAQAVSTANRRERASIRP